MLQRLLFVIGLLAIGATGFAQDQTKRNYTRADFINIDGGGLSERVERAFKQFKNSNRGDSVWIAYHFPAREGVSIGPFSGMIYYDDGIKLERREDPASAAIFLLTDATGSQPKFTSVKTLNLSEPFVFENRPVYWLGNADASQSIGLLENIMSAGKENKEGARGALRAIAAHNSPRAIPLLKEAAAKETNIDLRRSAVSNLARVKTPESLDALIELYDSSSEEPLKEDIIGGIARDDSRKAVDKLTSIAKNDPSPKMRQRAIRRLSTNRGAVGWSN
jgi:hypothetical protein